VAFGTSDEPDHIAFPSVFEHGSPRFASEVRLDRVARYQFMFQARQSTGILCHQKAKQQFRQPLLGLWRAIALRPSLPLLGLKHRGRTRALISAGCWPYSSLVVVDRLWQAPTRPQLLVKPETFLRIEQQAEKH